MSSDPPREHDRKTSPSTFRLTVLGVGGLLLGLTSALGGLIYNMVASLEGINDGRAAQVTSLFAASLAMVWLGGLISRFVATRSPDDTVLSHDGFFGLCVGVLASTALSGGALMALAWLSLVVVTPPAAWLAVSTAAGFGAILGAREARSRGTPGSAARR